MPAKKATKPTSFERKGKTIIALPKGRILQEVEPLFKSLSLKPEKDFYDEDSRKLSFATNQKDVLLIRVRSFDVATFVAFGAADIGICGSDVLAEFNYPDIYVPLDLGIGACRMSVAAPAKWADDKDFLRMSHIRVATKYPNITRKYFAEKGVQAECIKLSGAMELAPQLGLCRRIVDLVSSGATLKANGLVETDKIMDVTSRLIVGRAVYKTRSREMNKWISELSGAVEKKNAKAS